jgi:hypothetical protein
MLSENLSVSEVGGGVTVWFAAGLDETSLA